MSNAPSADANPSMKPVAQPSLTLWTKIYRFVAVGAFSGVIDFGLTLLLQTVANWDPWPAKAVGWVCGTITAYLINRRWTFQAEHSTKRFLAVMGLYVVTFSVQTGIYTGILAWLGETPLNDAIAYVIAQGTATVINFIVQHLVIFKIEEHEHEHEAPAPQ